MRIFFVLLLSAPSFFVANALASSDTYPYACDSGTVRITKFPDNMRMPILIFPDHFGCAGSGAVSLTYNGGRSNIIFPSDDKNKIYQGSYRPSQAKIFKQGFGFYEVFLSPKDGNVGGFLSYTYYPSQNFLVKP